MHPVDHDQRRQRILEQALASFEKNGYQSATLTEVADAVNCPRTMLYRYFKSKREIFQYTVKLLTHELATKYADIEQAPGPCLDKLRRVMDYVIESLFTHRVVLSVILDYVIAARRAGQSQRRVIARHSFGLRALLHRLVMAGIRDGEFRDVHPGMAVHLLYAHVEALMLRLTVTDNADRATTAAAINETLSWMKI